MCKCCQQCLEDLYWQCFEEKYCYDKNIANYDPAEDEYCRKNGHVLSNGETLENNNQPITSQPTRLQRNISVNSVKIHEDENRREVQIANVNLAPEILQVFANSQIFRDHKPLRIKPTSPEPATFSIGTSSVEKSKLLNEGSRKLMERLEEDKTSTATRRMFVTPPRIIETPAINEENEDDVDEVILRPHNLLQASSSDDVRPAKIVNKNLKSSHLDAPYFTQRPASENDIFTISTPLKTLSSTSDVNRFSQTPEVPSISFAHLPKNYQETPTIDKYRKEAPSLLEIQTAEIRNSMNDFSMPRYYGLNVNKSFDAIGSTSSIGSAGSSSSAPAKKNPEKSKRLKHLRTHLPPLTIHKAEKEK